MLPRQKAGIVADKYTRKMKQVVMPLDRQGKGLSEEVNEKEPTTAFQAEEGK